MSEGNERATLKIYDIGILFMEEMQYNPQLCE